MIILLKLLLAHLIGDFGLQFKKWVDHKQEYRLKSGYLYLHVGIHTLVTLLLLWPEIRNDLFYLWIPVIIMTTHFSIDAGKLLLRKRKSKKVNEEDTGREQVLFFIDQLLHLLVIFVIWYWVEGKSIVEMIDFYNEQHLLLLLSLFFLTQPAAIVIKILIAGWLPKNESKKKKTLTNAGRYIGILERLFVFGFVVTGNWSGIGFLLAAKSVFRFGDLRDKEGIKLTEYILIGTLLSFGLAMLVSVVYLKLHNFLDY